MIKKEIITAIAIGLLISAIIAGGILRAKSVIKQHQTNQPPSSPQSEATTTAQVKNNKDSSQLFLKINSPKNNTVVKENQVTLTGETLPHTYIAIITDSSEYLIVPNKIGQFSQQIKLIKGANLIKVTAYTKNGNKVEKTINLVYTEAEI